MTWRRRITRPCYACGRERSCRWMPEEGAWYCTADDCGAEWYPDHDPIVYGDPALIGPGHG